MISAGDHCLYLTLKGVSKVTLLSKSFSSGAALSSEDLVPPFTQSLPHGGSVERLSRIACGAALLPHVVVENIIGVLLWEVSF